MLAFQLLALMHLKKGKVKTSIKANYAAQTVVSVLGEEVPRNLDYLLAVNTLSAYLLLIARRPAEALEFIKISERFAIQLLDLSDQLLITYVKAGKESQTETPFKRSKITGMLLSNYILSINLMKSIAVKFSEP